MGGAGADSGAGEIRAHMHMHMHIHIHARLVDRHEHEPMLQRDSCAHGF